MTILIFQVILFIYMQQDTIIKFCVVGEPAVGKTSMLHQFVHKKFDEKVKPTIGCDFSTKLKSSVDGTTFRMQIWDIAGQQRFNAVSKMYLRGSLGCVVVCSSNDPATIQQTIKWKNIIQQNSDNEFNMKIPCILVQNKSDLIDKDHPQSHQTKKYLSEFAKTNGFTGFLQCSAKNNKNIDEIFQNLLDEAVKINLIKSSSTSPKVNKTATGVKKSIVLESTQVNTQINSEKRKKCC